METVNSAILILQSIDWGTLSKTVGLNIVYFLYFVTLIQTTVVAVVKSVSSIFYTTDDSSSNASVMASAILWSIYIIANMNIG